MRGQDNTHLSTQCMLLFLLYCLWMPLLVYKSAGIKDAALGPLTGIFHIHHLDVEKKKKRQSADQQPYAHSVSQDETGVRCVLWIKTSSFQ